MKKKLLLLVSLLVLLVMPAFVISAEEAITGIVDIGEIKEGTHTNKQSIKLTKDGFGLTEVKVTYTVGIRIKEFKCVEGDGWKVTATSPTTNSDGTTTYVCTYTSSDGNAKTGNPIALGSITYTNDTSIGTDKDCGIDVHTSIIKGNPDTGIELPYVILISGITLAGVAYFSTNKKTKIHKI